MVERTFAELLQLVRAKDERATAELFRRYEPDLRCLIRVRLLHSELRRLIDSADVCQSVFANFFDRLARGQFELSSPEQAFKLLATMAHNKLRDHVRKERAGRRAFPLASGLDARALDAIVDHRSSPAETEETREQMAVARECFSEEERYLLDQRALGREWGAIATDIDQSPEALRKRFTRALARVAQQLGTSELEND